MTSMARTVDINCDLGESFGNWRMGNDEELLPRISTANVACGFHGGDPVTMVQTVARALELGVAVGAHPGLPDLLGFGRRELNISPEDAYAYVLYQGGALDAVLRAHGERLHHVKPHGILYTMLNEREDLAAAVANAIAALMESPTLYWPAGADDGALVREGRRRGFAIVLEFYPDLRYTAERRIIVERRKQPLEPAVAVERLARFLRDGTIETIEGDVIQLTAESICVHGDGPTAPQIVAALRKHLDDEGWTVEVARGGTAVRA